MEKQNFGCVAEGWRLRLAPAVAPAVGSRLEAQHDNPSLPTEVHSLHTVQTIFVDSISRIPSQLSKTTPCVPLALAGGLTHPGSTSSTRLHVLNSAVLACLCLRGFMLQ